MSLTAAAAAAASAGARLASPERTAWPAVDNATVALLFKAGFLICQNGALRSCHALSLSCSPWARRQHETKKQEIIHRKMTNKYFNWQANNPHYCAAGEEWLSSARSNVDAATRTHELFIINRPDVLLAPYLPN